MGLDDALRHRQPQPAATLASAHQRQEHPLLHGGRNARPVVDHVQRQGQPIAHVGDHHLARDARPEQNGAAALHGLGSVAHQVQQRLHQLRAVGLQFRQAGVIVALDDKPFRVFGLHQTAHLFAHFVDVDACHRPPSAARRQQAIHQLLQPVHFLNDHARVFAHGVRLGIGLQQLCCPADAPQRIADLVRQLAQHGTTGARRLVQSRLPVDASAPLDLVQLDKQHAARIFQHHGQTMQGQWRLPGPHQGDVHTLLPPGLAAQLIQGRIQRLQVRQQLARRAAAHSPGRHRQQLAGRHIGKRHAPLDVQHQHARPQQVEPGQVGQNAPAAAVAGLIGAFARTVIHWPLPGKRTPRGTGMRAPIPATL